MAKIKLCIQNGHAGTTNGQTGTNGELTLVDKVFYDIKKIIDSQYSSSIALYYDDAKCLNAPNMDYYLPVHFDGSTDMNYEGGFVDCSPDSFTEEKDWEFARIIADNYFNEMNIKFVPGHRTVNSTYYYAFNLTGENTVQTIIECGTLTNPSDRAKCQDTGKIARLLVKGIVAYLKQYDPRFTGETIPTPPVTPPVSCETRLAELGKQLEEQKKSFTDIQESLKKQLADKSSECESYKSRLTKIKSFVAEA